MSTVTMAFTDHSKMCILLQEYSHNNLAGKTPLLVRDLLVNLWDILPETGKSRACWDMDGNKHFPVPYAVCEVGIFFTGPGDSGP